MCYQLYECSVRLQDSFHSKRRWVSLTSSFWEIALAKYMHDVSIPIERENYRFELIEDDLSGVLPQFHSDRLMKDEHIDGEIARDIGRTFPHHLLFRHKENGCQGILESVLRKISDSHFSIGYCQGMNYVVGAIMISLLDPELNGYYSDNDTDELQQRISSYAKLLFLISGCGV